MVSIGQGFFSHSDSEHDRGKSYAQEASEHMQRAREREYKTTKKQTTPAAGHITEQLGSAHERTLLKSSSLHCGIVSEGQLSDLTGQNVTPGPEVSERNERTVRNTVINLCDM